MPGRFGALLERIQMVQKPERTRQALINAAGELFSVHGLDGTSTREIADRAGSNVGGIHYHFGSKENLYAAAVIHAARHTVEPRHEPISDEALSSPEGVSQALRALIRGRFAALYSDEYPRWHGMLIGRCMIDSPASVVEVIEKVVRLDTIALIGLIRRARADLTEEEAIMWVFTFFSQMIFYCQNREAALSLMNQEEFNEGFFLRSADHTVRIMIQGLGLPEPAGS